jgi:hypothetical protein
MVARAGIMLATTEGVFRDAIGYWNAGLHIRSGAQLYFDAGPAFGSEVFLFAPWFAWVWAPLTYLPREPVIVSWGVAMGVAAVWAVRPFFRYGLTGALLGCVFAYGLAWGALWANVMPLLVGILIRTAGSRHFPIWVGIAASLKILPILYVWPDIRAGHWRRAITAVAIALVLWAPALFYGIGDYPTGYSPTLSLLQLSGWMWLVVALVAGGWMLIERRPRWLWLATAVAIIAAYPRLHLHYIGLLGVGQGDDL